MLGWGIEVKRCELDEGEKVEGGGRGGKDGGRMEEGKMCFIGEAV